MRNLLPPTTKRLLAREYYARVGAVVLMLFSAAGVLGIVALVPSYLLLSVQKDIAEAQYAFDAERVLEKEQEAPPTLLNEAASQLEFLEAHSASVYASEQIERFIKERPLGISLTTFFYRNEEAEQSLSISGMASDRDALLAFKRVLERSTEFDSVTLPVSNLAQDRDIPFSVVLTNKR